MFVLFVVLLFIMYPPVQENKKILVAVSDPLETLNIRYVKGEITKEEYCYLKRNYKGS